MMSQNHNCCLPLPSPVAKWCRRYCKYCRWPQTWPSLWPPAPSSWALACCDRCSCLCFRRPRVHPDSSASASTSSNSNYKVVVRRLNSSGSGGGVTNLSFQADDTDPHDQDQVNFNSSSVLEDGDGGLTSVSGKNIGLEPSSLPQPQKEWAYKRQASSLYLKTGPGKCIHVVHVKAKTKPKSPSSAPSPSSSGPPSRRTSTDVNPVPAPEPKPLRLPPPPNGHCPQADVENPENGDLVEAEAEMEAEARPNSEEEEDDEEYWFSKWSNRPKLKQLQSAAPAQSLAQIQSAPSSGSRRATHRLCIASSASAQAAYVNNFDIDIAAVAPDDVQLEICTDETTTAERATMENDEHGFTNHGFQLEQEKLNGNSTGGQVEVDGHDGASQCSTTLSMESAASASATDKQFPVPDEIINLNANANAKTPFNMYKTSFASAPAPNGVDKGLELTPTQKVPLLFFVHGLSASSDVWTAQLEHFHARGYELVAIDLLGHGLSSAPQKAKFYTFEFLLQDLVYVYDYFVPPPTSSSSRPTVLVGHGYGCCLTRVLSRLRPNQISALVSVAGGGPTPLAPPGTLRPPSLIPFQIPNIFAEKRSSARFDPLELRHVLPPQIRQHLIDGQIWLECDSAFHHRIQTPTLLVYGLRDTTVALVEECEMEKAMPKAFLELLPTAGHFPMLDEPRRLNRMVEKFLQAWLPSPPTTAQAE